VKRTLGRINGGLVVVVTEALDPVRAFPFRTTVRGGQRDGDVTRYATEREALEGHKSIESRERRCIAWETF